MQAPALLRHVFHGPRKPVVVFDFDDTLLQTSKTFGSYIIQWFSQTTGMEYNQADELAWAYYREFGNAFIGFQRYHGVRESLRDTFMNEVTSAYMADFHLHHQPDGELVQALQKVGHRAELLAIFTANTKEYAVHGLHTTALSHLFHPSHIVGYKCVDGHHKLETEAYKLFRRRTAHLPAHTPHIMIEDSPANIPAAKQTDFITVLVGTRDIKPEQRPSIDFHFPDIKAALHEMAQ